MHTNQLHHSVVMDPTEVDLHFRKLQKSSADIYLQIIQSIALQVAMPSTVGVLQVSIRSKSL